MRVYEILHDLEGGSPLVQRPNGSAFKRLIDVFFSEAACPSTILEGTMEFFMKILEHKRKCLFYQPGTRQAVTYLM